MRKILILLLLLPLIPGTPGFAQGGDCPTWGRQYGDIYTMTSLGCSKPVSKANWHAAPGTCEKRARQGGRAGYRGDELAAYMKQHGCILEQLYGQWRYSVIYTEA
jgi:hypothetical protein